jgi:hypothetical protein
MPQASRQEAIMKRIDDPADLPCFRADLKTA